MSGLTLDLLADTIGNITDKNLPYEEGEREGASCVAAVGYGRKFCQLVQTKVVQDPM